MKILIVDDSGYARKRIARVLSGAGYAVVEAEGGPAALALFEETRPTVVTVDLLMPEMDGLELIRRLRAIRADVHIIAISADVQRATREDVVAAGASWFVGKGEDPEEILQAVRMLVGEAPALGLTAAQEDTFTELMNVAMGRAAQALGSLLERPVTLHVPKVEVMSAAGLRDFLDRRARHVGAVVQQRFSGPLNGLAALILPHQHAVTLVRVLLATDRDLAQLSPAEQTVLAEVGNVVLNAAVGWLGDQMRGRILIALPSVALSQTHTAVVEQLFGAVADTAQALVFLSRLSIGDVDLVAYLLLLLPRLDVSQLLATLEE